MPVIPDIGKGTKTGKAFSGGMTAESSATTDGVTQSQIAGPALMPAPVPSGVIPVISMGIPISIAMIKIEALAFKSYETSSSLGKQLLQKYQNDLEKAQTKREAALNKLNTDLKEKQQIIQQELQELETELEELNVQLEELQTQQEQEMIEYKNIIFEIRDRAKKEENAGNIEKRDTILQEINIHDEWLAEIIKMSVDIITISLQITPLEKEIKNKKYLATVAIPYIWETDVELADSFEVVVPPYVDLPEQPTMPPSVPVPTQNEFEKAMRKAFAFWLVHPMIPPSGIQPAGTILFAQSTAPASPGTAIQTESDAHATVLSGGTCV